MSRHMLVVVMAVVIGTSLASGKAIYVDDDADLNGRGTAWHDPYLCLQNALSDAVAGDVILVAQGVYRPDRQVEFGRFAELVVSGDREATFHLKNGVIVKGGYAGLGEADPNHRDISAHRTVLSGDLSDNDIEAADPCDLDDEPTRFENSYSVLIGSDTNASAVLDGFTITEGHANGSSPDYGYSVSSGAGMYNNGGSPTVINCTFEGNWARRSGGGMSNHYGSQPIVTNCAFRENRALHSSGGMYNHEGSSPTVTDCEFHDNSTDWAGGAMENLTNSHPIVTNCTFEGNYSTGRNVWGNGIGGAMVNTDGDSTVTGCSFVANYADVGGGVINWGSGTNPIFTNCIFGSNRSISGGGMHNNLGSSPRLINCTFKGNTAMDNGGGMANTGEPSITNCTFTGNKAGLGGGIYSSERPPTLSNCILWSDIPEEFYGESSTPVIAYSNIQGGHAGTGNIDADPCFAAPGYWDPNGTAGDANDDFFVPGDYHLKSQGGRYDPSSQSWVYDDVTSPCIDAGDPMSPIGPEPLPNGGVVNMGAYGGMSEASKSYFGKAPCETIVAGDINGDCEVNFLDFCIMGLHWCEDHNP